MADNDGSCRKQCSRVEWPYISVCARPAGHEGPHANKRCDFFWEHKVKEMPSSESIKLERNDETP